MKVKASAKKSTSTTSIVILCVSFVCTIVFGVIGYHTVYTIAPKVNHSILIHWSDVCYSTLRLFTLYETPAEQAIKHWAISLARITALCTIFSSIALAAIFTVGGWIRSNIFVRFYKKHFIILGLNEETSMLVSDLLMQKKKVVIVYDGLDDKYLEEVTAKGAAVLAGDITTMPVLIKAAFLRAEAFIAMSGSDLTNLSMLQAIVESPYKPELSCFIGINNVNSYKLFEPGAFYSIENLKRLSPRLYINTFNINELVAIDLVQNLGLGANKEITSRDEAPVRILVAGFGGVGEAILRELLLLAHFCNGKKVNIQILADSKNGFFTNHHQILCNSNGNGLDLWDLSFVENEDQLKLDQLSEFDHIISAYEDDERSLSSILKFYDLCTVMKMREEDTSTTFHYFSAQKHDIKHEHIHVFGALGSVVNYNRLILQYDQNFVKRSHEQYAKSELGLVVNSNIELETELVKHDENEKNSSKWLLWVNQPLFKRRSNFTEYRHFIIKLQALGRKFPTHEELLLLKENTLDLSVMPYLNDFPELNTSLLASWLAYILEKEKITLEELIIRIDALGRSEHNRWNAFHIVNNWRYGPEKNEKLKTHDCLLSWTDLEKYRADTIKYDYKNVYHLVESLMNH